MFNVTDLNPEKLKLAFPHETIKIDGEPYLTRYYITGKNDRKVGEGRSIFLHQFHSSDQGRELHNHPYAGTSYILKGGYYEERMYGMGKADVNGEYSEFTEVTRTWYAPGAVNEIQLNAFHRTDLGESGEECWTLFITGDRVKSWGFINRETKEFFVYMDKNEVREGSGPHARDEIDTSIAVRRAETSMKKSGVFSVGDSVMAKAPFGASKRLGQVLTVESIEVEVGFADGNRAWRNAKSVDHADTVFVPLTTAVEQAVLKGDYYGCPDRSWLKSFSLPKSVSKPAEPVVVAPPPFKATKGQPAQHTSLGVVLVNNLYPAYGDVSVTDSMGNVLYVKNETLSETKDGFVVNESVDTDSYGCPDRSWMKKHQVKKFEEVAAPARLELKPKFAVGDMVTLDAENNKLMAFSELDGTIACRVEAVRPSEFNFNYTISTQEVEYTQEAVERDLTAASVFAPAEPKPKFAIGDLLVTAKGNIGTVVELSLTSVKVKFEDGPNLKPGYVAGSYWYGEESLELSPNANKFKVGETVRVVKVPAWQKTYNRRKGTVSYVNAEGYISVKLTNGREVAGRAEAFQHV